MGPEEEPNGAWSATLPGSATSQTAAPISRMG